MLPNESSLNTVAKALRSYWSKGGWWEGITSTTWILKKDKILFCEIVFRSWAKRTKSTNHSTLPNIYTFHTYDCDFSLNTFYFLNRLGFHFSFLILFSNLINHFINLSPVVYVSITQYNARFVCGSTWCWFTLSV